MSIGGGGSFSSDQTTLQKDTGAISLLRAGRARITSIQGRGEAGSVILLHDSATTGGAAAGNLVATFKYDTEGLAVYVPGSGILCKDGICATLTQTSGSDGSVTLTITGA
jgi:hypothetical protein